MKKFISNCLACAGLFALGACATEGPTTATTPNQKPGPANVDHSVQRDVNTEPPRGPR